MTNSISATEILVACLQEAGDDVEAGFMAAEYMISTMLSVDSHKHEHAEHSGSGLKVALSTEQEGGKPEEQTETVLLYGQSEGASPPTTSATDTSKERKITKGRRSKRSLFNKKRTKKKWHPTPALSLDPYGHEHAESSSGGTKGGTFVPKGQGGKPAAETAPTSQKKNRFGLSTARRGLGTAGRITKTSVGAAYHWLHSTGAAGFKRLPKPVQSVISRAVATIFSGWTASQKLAERISIEKGNTPEQAAQTKSILMASDLLAYKPAVFAMPLLGSAAMAASWVVPPVTACYLVHSTVRHPLATYRAAKSLVGNFLSKHTQILSIDVALANPSEWRQWGKSEAGIKRWQHTGTKEIRYQEAHPGEHGPALPEPTATPRTPQIQGGSAQRITTPPTGPIPKPSITQPTPTSQSGPIPKPIQASTGQPISQSAQTGPPPLPLPPLPLPGVQGDTGTGAPGSTLPDDARQPASTSQGVQGEVARPSIPVPDTGRQGKGEPTDTEANKSLRGLPKPAQHQEVINRIDKLQQWADRTGKSYIVNWLDDLKGHILATGAEASLEELGPQPEPTAEGQQEITYDPGSEYAKDWNHWVKGYLKHVGINSYYADENPHPIITQTTQGHQESWKKSYPPEAEVKFQPTESQLTDKLKEAKFIPGLETSEDISTIMGKPTTHITAEVVNSLDKRYGKGQWIIKPYKDDAYAGHGIYFPERVESVLSGKASTITESQEDHRARVRNIERSGIIESQRKLYEVGGYNTILNNTGQAVGIRKGDKRYLFGTPEYRKHIEEVSNTDNRDLAHSMLFLESSISERRSLGPPVSEHNGIPLLDREGKSTHEGYMAQPAFPAVKEDIKNRTEGLPYAHTEARVHVITKNGKATPIPYGTFYKKRPFPIIFHDDDSRAIEKAAYDAVMSVPEHQRQGHVYAPDVIKTANGYKVVEMNPSNITGSSGHLGSNPLIIDAYVSHLTGKEPGFVQFIRRVLSRKRGGQNLSLEEI